MNCIESAFFNFPETLSTRSHWLMVVHLTFNRCGWFHWTHSKAKEKIKREMATQREMAHGHCSQILRLSATVAKISAITIRSFLPFFGSKQKQKKKNQAHFDVIRMPQRGLSFTRKTSYLLSSASLWRELLTQGDKMNVCVFYLPIFAACAVQSTPLNVSIPLSRWCIEWQQVQPLTSTVRVRYKLKFICHLTFSIPKKTTHRFILNSGFNSVQFTHGHTGTWHIHARVSVASYGFSAKWPVKWLNGSIHLLACDFVSLHQLYGGRWLRRCRRQFLWRNDTSCTMMHGAYRISNELCGIIPFKLKIRYNERKWNYMN